MNNNTKDFLAKTVFKALSVVNKVIPKDKKVVLLYSNIELRDNVKAIYEYMIGEGYNQKYRIYVSSKTSSMRQAPRNVYFINQVRGIVKFFSAGHVFYAFGKIPIYPSNNQKVVQMWHGAPFKGTDARTVKMKSLKPYYTHFLTSSRYFEDTVCRIHFVNHENVAICGEPRTDVMYRNNKIPNELKKYNKYIMWLPTYRASDELGNYDVVQNSIIPIFFLDEISVLEKKLATYNIGLIVKLHPLQNLDLYKETNYEHILILSNGDFQKKEWDLYEILSNASALISDYSSVFFDYMLLNRPIGFAVDDIDEYGKNRGFSVDDPEYLMPGEKIKTKEDFYVFIDNIANDRDLFKKQREEVCRITHEFCDGNNCKRALEIGGVNL